MSRDDRELLRDWQAGDRDAGSRLIGRYVEPLQRFFVNKVRRDEDVEDLVQRTLTALVESVGGFRGEASLRTWIYAIARNILREWIREKSKREQIDFGTVSVADLGIGADTALDGRRDHQLMLEALRQLPIETQILLELYYLQQLRAQDIAVIDEVPEGTVRTRLRAARRDLARVLNRDRDQAALLDPTLEELDVWAASVREAWAR